jgi:hypothetical protein
LRPEVALTQAAQLALAKAKGKSKTRRAIRREAKEKAASEAEEVEIRAKKESILKAAFKAGEASIRAKEAPVGPALHIIGAEDKLKNYQDEHRKHSKHGFLSQHRHLVDEKKKALAPDKAINSATQRPSSSRLQPDLLCGPQKEAVYGALVPAKSPRSHISRGDHKHDEMKNESLLRTRSRNLQLPPDSKSPKTTVKAQETTFAKVPTWGDLDLVSFGSGVAFFMSGETLFHPTAREVVTTARYKRRAISNKPSDLKGISRLGTFI